MFLGRARFGRSEETEAGTPLDYSLRLLGAHFREAGGTSHWSIHLGIATSAQLHHSPHTEPVWDTSNRAIPNIYA
jgi:hypothetical protein